MVLQVLYTVEYSRVLYIKVKWCTYTYIHTHTPLSGGVPVRQLGRHADMKVYKVIPLDYMRL